jgi:formate hydrogenlyase subunit 4
MTLSFAIYFCLNTLLVLLISPLFIGLIKKVKAYMQGRRGPPVFQTYYLLTKLFKKETVYSYHSSFISRLSPYINIIFLLGASLCVPLVFIPNPTQGSDFGMGNVILFLYLMVTAKFFMALGGLDAGSSFGGMGSSREMTISAIFEPVVIIVVSALAFVLKSADIHRMFSQALVTAAITNSALILICAALFVVLIIETSRIPVDNPETHLELTMIHEAMLLESSGPNLALMELSHAVKNTLLMALLINIILPWGLATSLAPAGLAIAVVSFLVKGGALAIIIGIFESVMAKSRLFNIRTLFILAFSLAFLTIVFELLI